MAKPSHQAFLKDVFRLAFISFGGPQVHYALFLKRLVQQKAYLSEEQFYELQALCSVLPGPTSTQVLTAIGYQLGGVRLAYLTLLIWIFPAVLIMTMAAYGMTYLENKAILTFVLPVGVGLIIQAGWHMAKKLINGWLYYLLFALTLGFGVYFQSPYIFPIMIFLSATVSALNFDRFPKQNKHKMVVPWANFHLYWMALLGLALLGHLTDYFPLRLLENFYRNGSWVFGGGQVLAPVLFTEFVEFKHLISSEDFLTGMALSQSLPGPVFSLTSYLGVLLMKPYGLAGELMGALIGAIGIFAPGTFLIFFVIRIWAQLKQFRFIRASLAGIQAASVGLTFVAVYLFLQPMVLQQDLISLGIVLLSFLCAQFTRIPTMVLFVLGLLFGLWFY